MLGIQARPGFPYDGHMLNDMIAKIERLTGENVALVYVDKGHRGHGPAAREIHVTQSLGLRSPTVKRELRRRTADEPIIDRVRSDGLLERNRLAGACGDAINAVLVRLRVLFCLCFCRTSSSKWKPKSFGCPLRTRSVEQDRAFAVSQANGPVPARAAASSSVSSRRPFSSSMALSVFASDTYGPQ